MLADKLYEFRTLLRYPENPSAMWLAKVSFLLRDVRDLISASAADASTLEPILDHSMRAFTEALRADPDNLFAFVGRDGPGRVTDTAWDDYICIVRDRAIVEGGSLEAQGDSAIVTARDSRITLERDGNPDPGPKGGYTGIVTRNVFPGFVGAMAETISPVLIRLNSVSPSVFAFGHMPLWLLRLLDPRPDAAVATDLEKALTDGDLPPLVTEPFIIGQEYEADWPRGIINRGFERVAASGKGRTRQVPGVGLVLVMD
ncbi:MAG: hypothetical protein HY556_04845 [Euryarchaeota archaeon]|nr:hypothetical protein [Euryarchaeota archaeon]